MVRKIVFFFGFAMLLLCCDQRSEKGSFDSLTEDQKRLPENALSGMKVADGLEVELFAAEPMLTNPTNISVDAQGRVWVCEAYNYDVAPDQADKKGDRIVVLEDVNEDGKADKRTVFYQGTDLFLPLGITVLDDKIYVTCSPNVFVFTDNNGDLIPESKQVLFSKMSKGEHSTHSLFPGPDGMLYFSIGNYTREIVDKNGNPLIDKAGFTISQTGNPYLGGMVLRCTPDGNNVEVLGHNFRNNYEPCVDSFGNVWQSDNDDDGNESCRINFVMHYGNYGFLDEMTRASWTTNRINREEKIQQRHWHQNDPGVVPNVLITGAGSPAGMTFYEGDLLPPVFRNVPIHAEPYYNVVRAYLPAKKGAGYTLEIEDILRSQDKWFRPVDVTTAPDGSLFIADWYDPILGGGAAGDANKGRIYRVAPDVSRYSISPPDVTTNSGAVAALKSPNNETRYIGFQQLQKLGDQALPALQSMWKSEDIIFRVRALWLLAKREDSDAYLREALTDRNPDIRIAGIRALALHKKNIIPYLSAVVRDDDASVRREVALALRYYKSPEAASLWVELANQYDAKDRWYLEALGIGSDLHADLFFDAWQQMVTVDFNNKVHQDIIWRSRSDKALPLLAELIKVTPDTRLSQRYFRAFDFHNGPAKTQMLSTLLALPREDSNEISAMALQQMDGKHVKMTPVLHKALAGALQQTKGTVAFVNLVDKFFLKDKQNDLLQLATEHGDQEAGAMAADLLLKFNAVEILQQGLHKNDSSSLLLLQSLRGKGSTTAITLISQVVRDSSLSIFLRKNAVQVLGSSWPGEEKLLTLVKSPSFEKALKPVAAGVLFNVYRSRIQREAAEYLDKPATQGSALPTIKELLASTGNAQNGKLLFETHCSSCHRIDMEGEKFGPELSQIGEKLAKDGLYRAIIYPSEGVSFGFESTRVIGDDETEYMGIVASETETEITLNLPGGSTVTYPKEKVKRIEKDSHSLMPSLAGGMSKQELIDLVEYLTSLKKN